MLLFKRKEKSRLPKLALYNTLSGSVEAFVPLDNKKNGTVKMYNCGPTVYDRQHIGNLRGPVLANVLRRTLEAWGYPVMHVSNITDVGHLTGDNSGDANIGEDRMEASAKKSGKSAADIAHEYTGQFYQDLDALGIDRGKITFTPATQYIGEQLALIKTLEEKGYTYTISDGVYFDISKFPQYGKLGHVDLAGERAGARVEENKEKKNPHDFALWKFSKAGEQRQQEWPSPWGVGFPGWHIECTAMIFKLLGKQIDIHIGGIDLIPIHHNNELAQAEAATGKPFVRYWMHNEFITIEGKKVSKSLGNTIYLSQLTDHGLFARALRYWYLTGHYRSPMNFTWEALEGANAALVRLARAYNDLADGTPDEVFLKKFYEAVADDLDTPKALALIWENIKSLNKATLAKADSILGLGLAEVRVPQKLEVKQDDLPEGIRALLAAREAARAKKDFAKADEIRAEIESAGFELKDTPDGPQISKK